MDEIREALSKRSGPLTWPLETEYGRVRDFREYVCKSERALGGDVRVTVPDAAGMKKLLRDAHPGRDFDIDPEKRSRQRRRPRSTRRRHRDDNAR